MTSFNVIIADFNYKTVVSYDIMPYFVECYKAAKKKKKPPKTFEEFQDFIRKNGMYRFWSKCEYEMIIVHWPYDIKDPLKNSKKIDVWYQINNNLDVVTKILMENVL